MSNPEFNCGQVEMNEAEPTKKPIDALVVFGFGLISDVDFEKTKTGNSLIGQPEMGWRLPIGAKFRILAAAELFADDQVKDMIITGGVVKANEGIDFSEASQMKLYLEHILRGKWRAKLKNSGLSQEEVAFKVDQKWYEVESHIILEDKAVNTIENFAHTINLLEEKKEEYSNIALLSNDFHIDRLLKLAGKFGVKGEGFGAETVISESSLDPRIKDINQKYFNPEKNSKYREVMLADLTENDQLVAQQRMGVPVNDYMKGERRWSRALDEIPEYWLPNIKFVENFEQLKRILKAEESVQTVLKSRGIDQIDLATEEEMRQVLDGIKRKMPPSSWEN